MRIADLRREDGSGLTEFAIIAPMFILLVLWAQFFTDLGILKLKVDEAAHFALWEMAAQRPTATVTAELNQRFADLSSPDARNSQKPYGVRAFPSVTVTSSINNQINADFAGKVQNNGGGGGGIVAQVMSFIANLANKAVKAILKIYGFDTRGEAQATVTFTAPNTMFPGASFLGYVFKDGVIPQITITSKSEYLLVDTWKAWPGAYSISSKGNVDSDPNKTYDQSGSGSPADQEVAARMGKVAFLGIAQKIAPVNQFMNMLKLPALTPTSQWLDSKQKQGPISMFPGAPATKSFSPASGKYVQRAGKDFNQKNQNLFASIDSPDMGVDRARSTTPAALHTDWWTSDGGYARSSFANQYGANSTKNPYVKAYKCRDVFYMGASKQEVQRWGVSFTQWARNATQKCP